MIKKNFNALIIGFSMFILVLGLPAMIALCPSLYFNEAKKTGADLYLDDADYFYENVHGFLLLKNNLADEFTADEVSHMRDVRFIFSFFRFASLLLFLLLGTYLFFIMRIKNSKKRKLLTDNFISSLKKGAILSLFVFLFLIFFVLINFSSSFNVFHYIFFPQGNWTFPVDSLLITLFPESFFVNVSKKIFVVTLILATAAYFFLSFQEKKYKAS